MNMTEFEEKLRQHGESAVKCVASPFDIESEDLTMNRKRNIKNVMLIAAAAVIMLCTTAFAAYKLMTPYEIAREADYQELADVLSEDDVKFDIPPQQTGDYTIQLFGITTGKNLSNFTEDFGNNDRSYIIGAISRTDGKSMEDTEYAGMTLTPLISGYKPWEVNIFTLGGGRTEFMEDGVVYFVCECDSIEIFADHTVYIALYGNRTPEDTSVSIAPSSDIFKMEADGSIRFADGYDGLGAIFTVPLEKSKADPQKAEEYLKTILDNSGEGENASEASDENSFAAQADAAVEIQSAD